MCQLTEKVIRQEEKLLGGKLPKNGHFAEVLTVKVMRHLSGQLEKLYPELHEHMLESAAD